MITHGGEIPISNEHSTVIGFPNLKNKVLHSHIIGNLSSGNITIL